MKQHIFKISLVLLLIGNIIPALAQLKLPALVSDNMVLQRAQPLNIWGWADAGQQVRISFNHKNYQALTTNDGKWSLTLPALKAGGPYTMQISTDKQTMQIKNILIGDVWLCSGQSNMEFLMAKVQDKYAAEIASAGNPNIREFTVKHKFTFTPVSEVAGSWVEATPESVLQYTAVGYFFARALYEKYKVPIGLIHSSWGGTPAEAWTSREGLKDFPDYLKVADHFLEPGVIEEAAKRDKMVTDDWFANVRKNDKGFAAEGGNWATSTLDDTWKPMTMPNYWEDQGVIVDGVVWLRKEITLTKEDIGDNAVLDLGVIDDSDTSYVNGVKIGSTGSKYQLRRYNVPAKLLKEGKNTIVIRIIDTDNHGGMVKGKKYFFTTKSKKIDLSGDWYYKVGVSVAALPLNTFTRPFYAPTSLYNGMIAPLIPYTIKGTIWYQGEANTGKSYEYRDLLATMIGDWRSRWNEGDFPFLIVQLANISPSYDKPVESHWAELRESQAIVASKIKNGGLAVAIDVGEANDIHPLDKKDVGDRLALAAQKIAYHDNKVVYSGPVYQSMVKQGDKIILSFTNTGSGMVAKDGGKLTQFAIAGSNKHFVWADAVIQGNKIIVSSDQVKDPVAVRYAWANNPAGSNLYNKEGLPAPPFRTDDWR